jgi:hypothetical protein
MKDITEIREEIAPLIDQIENQRKVKSAQIKHYQKWYLYAFGLAILGFLFLLVVSDLFFISILIWISAAVLIAFTNSKINPIKTAYTSTLKSQLVTAFVQKIYPNASFNSNKRIEQQTFLDSDLFGKRITYYNGEDYCQGTTENGTTFEFSEVRATRTSGTGKNKRTTVVFDGLFFSLKLPTPIVNNKVAVMPDSAEKTLGRFGKFLQKKIGSFVQGAKMIYFEEHPEFEKEYVVYALDESDARQILTPTLIGILYQLKYKWNTPLYVSFIDNTINIGIPNRSDWFRLTVNDALNRQTNNKLDKLFDECTLCFALIEEMANLDKLSKDETSTHNWGNSAYDHFNDSNNPFLL